MGKGKTTAAAGGAKTPRVRNTEIAPGVRKLGRSQALSATGRWRFLKTGAKGKKVEKKAEPAKAAAGSKFYEAEDVATPLRRKNPNAATRIAKLRKNIVPGTVLIVLAGRFRGKRVVFLKQLHPSGLLLVTGPFANNGVPIRRINQAYCIATSVKVDLAGVELPADISDSYFKRVENNEDKSRNAEKYAAWMAERKKNQSAVDAALIKNIAAVPQLKEYLASRFSLSNGQAPHLMKF